MAGSVFDSALFSRLFPTADVGRLFTDAAEIRAMLLVEGVLARTQGDMGLIPQDSAQAITRAAMEIQLDPGALAQPTGQNGVSVPGLVDAFRTEMQAPEHAQYVHWGATSQDIIDTGLMLRLRQALTLMEADLAHVLDRLANLADDHAELPMPARTFGQHATVTSFGAVAASWGAPLLDLLREMPGLRDRSLFVSLSGAAGTASELGPDAPDVRAALAKGLGLNDPKRSWHTDRGAILRLTGWMTRVTVALGKLGEDAVQMVQTGIGEIDPGGAGSSSTMPQKQNPIAPSTLVALARQSVGLNAVLQGAAMPRNQRDGAAWFTEWMCLPQIVLGTASALTIARDYCAALEPRGGVMAAALVDGLGLIHAEALSFALTDHMPRPEAQAAVKALCREAFETDASLETLVKRDWPGLDTACLFTPARKLGQAPAEARAFAAAVRTQRQSQT